MLNVPSLKLTQSKSLERELLAQRSWSSYQSSKVLVVLSKALVVLSKFKSLDRLIKFKNLGRLIKVQRSWSHQSLKVLVVLSKFKGIGRLIKVQRSGRSVSKALVVLSKFKGLGRLIKVQKSRSASKRDVNLIFQAILAEMVERLREKNIWRKGVMRKTQ
ncbi:hypothetical protein AVEN_75680-1 [Araneus ventricosus]|uniref:Uncharacterized protein n=1 Tax=Araneus ventricosus TaxID=182803 RepID=A0A4Y2D6I5_ARAVE|nr:hypothetical protein AVEN_75680-1 [Araneus ventricosus]